MAIKFKHLDTGNTDTTESYFSDQLLKARVESGLESNAGYDPIFEEGRSEEWKDRHWKEVKANDLKYDEDVNQYITLTLADLANPQSLSLIHKYVVGLDADVGQIAVNQEQTAIRYYLYKINADFLLLNLGLFNPDTNVLGDAYIDKGESYYYCAATSLKKVDGGRSGTSDVLEKLSSEFKKYVVILRQMKNSADNFFSFHIQISNNEMRALEQTLSFEVRKKKGPGHS